MAENLTCSILLKHLKIYQWIFALFGLNWPPSLIYRSEKDSKYFVVFFLFLLYSVLLLGFCIWAIYAHNQIVFSAVTRYRLDSITKVIGYIQNTAQPFLLLLLEYKSWCCHSKFLDILQMFNTMENNLLRICPEMFKEERLSRRLFQTTGVFLVTLSVLLYYINYILIAGDMTLRDRIFAVFFLICMQMKFLEYGVYIQLITEYLIMLLNSLKCLKMQVENETQRQQPLKWFYVKTLKENKSLLIQVWHLVYKLDDYFAWPIILLIFYNGLTILSTVNWAYVHYIYETREVFQALRASYITLILLNMLLLCYLTQKCINEYKKSSYLLLNFKLYAHDEQMIMAIKEYSLQLKHQPIEFSCNGYLDIDVACFGSITLTIFTYTIILVQFKLTNPSEGVAKVTKGWQRP